MHWTLDHSSTQRLQDQVAACVVRGLHSGELSVGEQLPPAAELAEALSVDRNTVLAAYRQLREAGMHPEGCKGQSPGANAAHAMPAPTVARTGMPAGSKSSRQYTLMPRWSGVTRFR